MVFKLAWSKNGTPHTLGGTATTNTITDMTAKKFNVVLNHLFKTATLYRKVQFNSDTTSVYARRYQPNGGADAVNTSSASIIDGVAVDANDEFFSSYFCSISGEEKLYISFGVNRSTAGAGTAPARIELVGKYVPSPDADITSITVDRSASTWAASTNLSALGTD